MMNTELNFKKNISYWFHKIFFYDFVFFFLNAGVIFLILFNAVSISAAEQTLQNFSENKSGGYYYPVYETRIRSEKLSLKSQLQSQTLDKDDLKNHGSNMSQTLSLLPSVSTYGASSPGLVPTVFIQGAGSDHTQFYWNGFLLKDPSTGSGGFDVSLLQILFSAPILQSVQLYSGAQGVEYGNGAIGGVILLSSMPSSSSASSLLSSSSSADAEYFQWNYHQSFSNTIYLKNSVGHSEVLSGRWIYSQYQWNFLIANHRNDGPSAAAPTPTDTDKYYSTLNQMESDSEENKLILFDYQYQPFENPLKLKTIVLYSSLLNSNDAAESLTGDDPNAKSDKKFFQMGLGIEYPLNDEHKISGISQWIQTDRTDTNETDLGTRVTNASSGLWQNNSYLGQSQNLQLEYQFQNNIFKNKLGLQKQTDYTQIKENFGFGESQINESQDLNSFYWKPEWTPYQNHSMSVGSRRQCVRSVDLAKDSDCMSVYEMEWNYLNPQVDGYFIRWGQGIKNPTLFQRHSTLYGKKDLGIEQVDNYSLGYQRQWNSEYSIQIKAFKNDFRHLIQYNNATSKYDSLGQAQSWGLDWQLIKKSLWWDMRLQGSYLQAKDQDTNLDLLRRPRQQVAWIIDWPSKTFNAEWAWFSEVRYRSAVADYGNIGNNKYGRVKMPETVLLSWGVSKKITSNSQIQFRWNNFLSRWWTPLRPLEWGQDQGLSESWGYSGQQEQVWLGFDCFLPEMSKKN